jgi:PPOX class probable F420-dependent enzyme
MAPPGIDVLGNEKYLQLTTFRKTGVEVGTAVWVVREGDHLLVTTTKQSGKVKRIRHTSRVLLAPCDRMGKVASDATKFEGTAELIEAAAELDHVQQLIQQKYGVLASVIGLVNKFRHGSEAGRIAIRLTLPTG